MSLLRSVTAVVAEITDERYLSVVVPCYNEVDHIEECVARVLREPSVLEIVVVDDGSTDGTHLELRGVTDPRVRVIRHSNNHGKGAALRTGFAQVTGLLVIVQDADLEQDPADYGRLAEPILKGLADVVYGSRFLDRRRQPEQQVLHYFANRVLTLLSNRFTGFRLTDMETGYKIFRREVLDGITINENRFGVEPELTAKISAAGWRVLEVPVSYRPRNIEQGKKIGWRDGLRAIMCIVRYSSAV